MKLLVIEDDIQITNFLKVALEAENFIVDIAADGEKGSFLGRTNDYDLIILDNVLPKKEGSMVCREIREGGKDTPIIMLTINSEIDTKVKLFKLGVDDYLTKPFSFEELLVRIRALLKRPKIVETEFLNIKSLTIDKQNYRVIKGNKEVYLTRKEFILLEYLANNRGRVLSRGKIMEHVWDVNTDPFSNTVETHIANLRKKIGCKASNRIINTVPGRGYKI